MLSVWRCRSLRDLAWWTPLTPLQLRLSLRRLWHHSRHPFRLFFWLIRPWPWRFKIPPQLSPRELKENPKLLDLRQDAIDQLRCMPLFQRRDTALRSVYRLYEALCCGVNAEVSYEVEYFYFHREQWRIEDIPDPQDGDLERYAVVAGIVDALAESFNWRYKLLAMARDRSEQKEISTREVSPEWTKKIGRLPEPLVFEHGIFEKEVGAFASRNVHLSTAYFYSV